MKRLALALAGLAVTVVPAVVVGGAPTAEAVTVLGQTRVAVPGVPSQGTTMVVDLSRDGRYIGYNAAGGGLWGRFDRLTGATVPMNGFDTLSGDGRYALVGPLRLDLVSGAVHTPSEFPVDILNGNAGWGSRSSYDGQVYATRDGSSGTTWIVDLAAGAATQVPGAGAGAFVSGDGRWVSYGDNCSGIPSCNHTWLLDRRTGTTTLIDDVLGVAGLSHDGRYGTYLISADDALVTVMLYDRLAGRSRPLAGYFPGGLPPIRTVVDLSDSGQRLLVEGQNREVYVLDWSTGSITGLPGVAGDRSARLSGDGRIVASPAGSDGTLLLTELDEELGPYLRGGQSLHLPVAGRGGVPADATAAVLNVTVTNPTGSGYVTVWPCDAPRPTASNLNYVAGQTVPNAVLTKLAADGTACLYTLADVDLVVDVNGAFTAGSGYAPLTPDRLLDSRTGPTASLAAGAITTVQVAGRGGVPADAGAAVLNVTVTNPTGPGYVTVWPCDAPRPTASNLNYVAGQTIPNAVLTKLAADGTACLYTLADVDLVVDVNGAFTAGSGYAPLTPDRLLDSRTGQSDAVANIAAGTVTEVRIAGRGETPSDATAAALNVTVTNPAAAGYVTVWPCDAPRPTASSLNFVAGQTVPNAVLTALSSTGAACFWAPVAVDLVVDVDGAFGAGAGYAPLPPVRLADTRV